MLSEDLGYLLHHPRFSQKSEFKFILGIIYYNRCTTQPSISNYAIVSASMFLAVTISEKAVSEDACCACLLTGCYTIFLFIIIIIIDINNNRWNLCIICTRNCTTF
ncbi:hypothetical protein I4U23_022581 [Adineta vaga]|nr:hypothetical protein I4U23_022581 [Adineta vaga]